MNKYSVILVLRSRDFTPVVFEVLDMSLEMAETLKHDWLKTFGIGVAAAFIVDRTTRR